MHQIIERITNDIKQKPHLKTNDIRVIAKSYRHDLTKVDLNDVYHIVEALLSYRLWAYTIAAYQLIYDQRKRYTKETYPIFESWLFSYISDWWDCDDFMTHAFVELFKQFPEFIPRIYTWIDHERFAVRRSAPVVLIRLAQKKMIKSETILDISQKLMNDPHDLVQKGYGWLLKESMKSYKQEIIPFLMQHVDKMPRIAFRYAIEKLPKEERDMLMHIPYRK